MRLREKKDIITGVTAALLVVAWLSYLMYKVITIAL